MLIVRAWTKLEFECRCPYCTNNLSDQRLRVCAWDVESDCAGLREGDAGQGECRDGCVGGEHRVGVKIESARKCV